jgi:hypothetical protein
MFGTGDSARATAVALENGFNVSWIDNETMVLVNTGPPMRPHPLTEVPAFHMHLHVLHESALQNGLAFAARLHENQGERASAWGFLARRFLVLAWDW